MWANSIVSQPQTPKSLIVTQRGVLKWLLLFLSIVIKMCYVTVTSDAWRLRVTDPPHTNSIDLKPYTTPDQIHSSLKMTRISILRKYKQWKHQFIDSVSINVWYLVSFINKGNILHKKLKNIHFQSFSRKKNLSFPFPASFTCFCNQTHCTIAQETSQRPLLCNTEKSICQKISLETSRGSN